jgi:hypothetical protein
MRKRACYLLLAGMLVSAVSVAQSGTTLSPTKNLDAYVGTWEYVTATETFRVTFVRGMEYGVSTHSECIIGGYLYRKNGTTVADYTANIPTVYNVNYGSLVKIMGTNAKFKPEWVDPNELRIYFYDEKVGYRTMEGHIELLSPTQIRWILRDPMAEFPLGPAAERDQYTVPTEVVMTKVVVSDPPKPPVVPGQPIDWIDFGD